MKDELLSNRVHERFDPDRWVASGKKLLDWQLVNPNDDNTVATLYYGAHPELAAHISRHFGRIAECASADQKVGEILTEEQVRVIWEETR